jgi:hypothetical protein
MRFLLVEPHPDDISLSLMRSVAGLKSAGHELFLVTMTSYSNRSSQLFCKMMGIKWMGSGGDDLNFKEKRMPLGDLRKYVGNSYSHLSQDAYVRFRDDIRRCAQYTLYTLKDTRANIVIGPVGIYHPMHIVTAAALQASVPKGKLWYYLDFPYFFRQYGKRIWGDFQLLFPRSLNRIFIADQDVTVEQKLKLFKDCYPTERSILKYDEEFYYTHEEGLFEVLS